LLAAVVCAGCIGPFRAAKKVDSCAAIVGQPANCSSDVKCGTDCEKCRQHGIVYRTAATAIDTACLPYRAGCRVVNFCVPSGVVGPPDVCGPGRFHPVPTHPVFTPAPEQIAYPAEF